MHTSLIMTLLRSIATQLRLNVGILMQAKLLGWVAVFLIFAQASQAVPIATSDGPVSGKIQTYDFFILALSWSPTYCASSAKRGETPQCRNPANNGFVVHGLWPQARDGARLRCQSDRSEFSKALFERALEVFPDLRLAQNQWQRHGHCFGYPADAYLELTARAKSKIAIPDNLRSINTALSLDPDVIRSGFIAANSGLARDSISVSCRKSILVEVLLCLKSDLSGFESCPQVTKRSCPAAMISVPAATQR
jgi:ribonuclease T2